MKSERNLRFLIKTIFKNRLVQRMLQYSIENSILKTRLNFRNFKNHRNDSTEQFRDISKNQ